MATTAVAVATMKMAQIPKLGADFEIIEREIPKPGARQVRIKVQACGVCHSDVFVKEGLWPGIQYPRVPGHEVAGIIDELGAEVAGWNKGQRVGVGWHGGQDNTCLECRRGHFLYCRNLKVTGIDQRGSVMNRRNIPPPPDDATELLAALPMQAIVFAFTTTSYLLGPDGEQALKTRLAREAFKWDSSATFLPRGSCHGERIRPIIQS
jgi:D-arabinose 1-dehydrogenase-like Zn-dependent alcohol dehydrogenase